MISKRRILFSLSAALLLFSVCLAAETINYGYDELDRLVSIEYVGAGSIQYVYDQAGDIVNVTIHVTNGTVVDSDNDGIADDWEMRYFDSLDFASAISDVDDDRYSDLWEYMNWKDGLLDRKGNTFDPTVVNSSGARGYGVGLDPIEFIAMPWIPLLLLDE